MKLKCAGCLVNPKRGIRNAITVFDGVALCDVHLKETVRAIKKAREEFIKQQKEKEEKKVETANKGAVKSVKAELSEG